MAIPADCTHVVLQGDLAGGEFWQSGFWLNGGTPADAAAANTMALLLWDALMDSGASGAMRITLLSCGASVSFRRVRVYPYPAGGPSSPFVGQHEDNAAGAGSDSLPNQCAFVLTLETALSGRSFRGRAFLPITGLNLSAGNGQANAGQVQTIVDGWAAFCGGWNTGGAFGEVAVISPTRSAAHRVTAVSMDTRPDVQRRRANHQAITARRRTLVA